MAMPARRWVGYALLITGLLLLFDTDTFLRTNWSPLHVPMSVPTEIAWAFLLTAGGITTFIVPILLRVAPVLLRFVSSFAPDASAKVGQGFSHQSVDLRLQRRLPLKRKFSSLPNLVGGTTMLLLVIPTFLMVVMQFPPAKGIYVRLAPRQYSRSDENCLEVPIIVTMNRHNEATRMLLNGKEIGREELASALKAALARRADWEVHVEGDDSVPYADAMYVVDVVTSLQAKAVFLTPKLQEQIAANGCSNP
jgi:biopolymer transport protein ExbD